MVTNSYVRTDQGFFVRLDGVDYPVSEYIAEHLQSLDPTTQMKYGDERVRRGTAHGMNVMCRCLACLDYIPALHEIPEGHQCRVGKVTKVLRALRNACVTLMINGLQKDHLKIAQLYLYHTDNAIYLWEQDNEGVEGATEEDFVEYVDTEIEGIVSDSLMSLHLAMSQRSPEEQDILKSMNEASDQLMRGEHSMDHRGLPDKPPWKNREAYDKWMQVREDEEARKEKANEVFCGGSCTCPDGECLEDINRLEQANLEQPKEGINFLIQSQGVAEALQDVIDREGWEWVAENGEMAHGKAALEHTASHGEFVSDCVYCLNDREYAKQGEDEGYNAYAECEDPRTCGSLKCSHKPFSEAPRLSQEEETSRWINAGVEQEPEPEPEQASRFFLKAEIEVMNAKGYSIIVLGEELRLLGPCGHVVPGCSCQAKTEYLDQAEKDLEQNVAKVNREARKSVAQMTTEAEEKARMYKEGYSYGRKVTESEEEEGKSSHFLGSFLFWVIAVTVAWVIYKVVT